MSNSLLKAQEARLQKALDQHYNFGKHGVMSLRRRLAQIDIVEKSRYVRKYARHKRQGYQKELAHPATEYTVWYLEDGEKTGYDVPKLVYDWLVDIPERGKLWT